MKTLVLGDGLLGSAFKVYKDTTVVGHKEIDITDRMALRKLFKKHKPDVVINCAGIVPKAASDVGTLFRTNGTAPHLIADELPADTFMVQISSNCVYPIVGGPFNEHRIPEPVDLYGYSKWLGELTYDEYANALTVRLSFVGIPDPNGYGLLSWASRQQVIIGYDKVLWNGLTTLTATRLIRELIHQRKGGVYHLYGPDTTKYDLLDRAKTVFGWNYQLMRDSELSREPFTEDRRLYSVNLPLNVKQMIQSLDWNEMLHELL